MSQVNITDITTGTLDGTGYFDELMKSINAHVNEQYISNRIKGSDYANVYLGSIQYALQQAFQFATSKYQVEEQVKAANIKLVADLVATYGYDAAYINNDGDIVLGTRTDNGILNKQEDNLDKDLLVKDRQIENIDFEEGIKRESLDDQLLTSIKQRILLDTEEEIKQYQYDYILPEEYNKLLEEIKNIKQKYVGRAQ